MKILGTFILTMILILQGCTSDDKVKIGFLYSTDAVGRFVREAEYFKERVQQAGVDVVIRQAENDENLQRERFHDMVKEGIDLLVLIAVNENTASAIVRDAHEEDIPVVGYVRLIRNCKLDYFVGGDSKRVGSQIINTALSQKPKGNYVILGGDMYDQNAPVIMKSIENAITSKVKSGDIKVLYKTYIEKWSEEIATFELEKVLKLTGEKPDAIISCYDGFSEGAISLLEKYKYEDVFVSGQDAELRAIKNIIKGKQSMTVLHPLKKLAYQVADIALGILNKKQLPDIDVKYVYNGAFNVPVVYIEPILITAENIQPEIIDAGVYSETQVYEK